MKPWGLSLLMPRAIGWTSTSRGSSLCSPSHLRAVVLLFCHHSAQGVDHIPQSVLCGLEIESLVPVSESGIQTPSWRNNPQEAGVHMDVVDAFL